MYEYLRAAFIYVVAVLFVIYAELLIYSMVGGRMDESLQVAMNFMTNVFVYLIMAALAYAYGGRSLCLYLGRFLRSVWRKKLKRPLLRYLRSL